jgi:TrmH family RNA methyltransferase
MIESVHNPRIKKWAELLTKKGREKHSRFLIEGVRLVEEGIRSQAPIEAVIWESGKSFEILNALPPNVEQWEVSEAVIKKLTDTENAQGIAAVVRMEQESAFDLNNKIPSLILLVDGVQDPGNLGTIIRSADAAGADGVILGKGTVDLYNPKVVRSTMGSLFHLPIITASLEEWIPRLKGAEYKIIATSLETDQLFSEINYSDKCAIIVGNEGNGVRRGILDLSDVKVKIPIYGKAESLNVGVAASLLLYEARRGRR